MDRSVSGRVGATLPQSDVPHQPLPDDALLRDTLDFPEVSENELVRYLSQLSQLKLLHRPQLLPARQLHDEVQPEGR